MSKVRKPFPLIVATLGTMILTLSFSGVAGSGAWSPPPITAFISVQPGSSPNARVEGRFSRDRQEDRQKTFTIAVAAAGIPLGDRVGALELRDLRDNLIPFRKIGPGEYLAEREIHGWSYTIALSPVTDQRAAAHGSWFSADAGVLVLGDLLPEFGPWSPGRPAWINFLPPGGSPVIGLPLLEDPSFYPLPSIPGGQWYNVNDSDEAVAFVGNDWRTHRIGKPSGAELIISGQWNFSDKEAEDMIREVLTEYTKLFRQGPASEPRIALSRFPRETRHGRWEAETKGDTVIIISSDMPFKTQSLQRLHEQLRHELFHLWIPNGVNLTGNYDWFYEGFALYQSLKLAVGLNRIRFEDFLDTLSRAHTIDSAGSQRISLIQASAARFSGANTQVYARGMLVGFLCDLALIEKSKGKRSVEDVLRSIFVRHRKPASPTDGNTAVIAELESNLELVPFVEKYVTGAEKMHWSGELAAAGIEDTDAGPRTTLHVKEKLSGRQKTTLDKLGYNNWRNSPRKSK